MKKILLVACLLGLGLIFACLLGEGALTAYHYFKHHTFSRTDLILSRERALRQVPGYRTERTLDSNREWENTLVIHPFFGYVYNPKLPDVNNFGFKSKYDIAISGSGYSLIHEGEKDPLVVGIFGGSFAQFAGFRGEYLERRLADLFPGRTPIVMNFSVSGHALPQAAFIFIYFKELFDVAVFIDGLNEAWNAVENNKAGCPPEYAKAFHFQYKLSLNELSPERFMLTSQIISTKSNLMQATRISLLPILRQSLLVQLIWRKLTRHWDYQILLKSLDIKKGYEQGPKFFDAGDEFLLDHAARQWRNYHQLIHAVASLYNVLDVHLIQPNPFVENSKPLTREEIDRINASYNIRDYVVAGYPKLQMAMRDLKKTGLVAEDLSYIYMDIKAPLWTDAAHANITGYEIVLDRVYELIEENYH